LPKISKIRQKVSKIRQKVSKIRQKVSKIRQKFKNRSIFGKFKGGLNVFPSYQQPSAPKHVIPLKHVIAS